MYHRKKIGVIIGHPTQFEGPLFQYIAKEDTVDLEVIFYNSQRMSSVYDPELKLELNWGIDLLTGYKHYVVPNHNKFLWLKKKIKEGNYDLLIVNGYSCSALLYSIFIGKIYSKAIALRLDTVEFSNVKFIRRILKKKVFWMFDKIFNYFLAIGSLTIKYLKNMGIDESKIKIFSYVVDNDFFKKGALLTNDQKKWLRDTLKIPDNVKVIISVAKFSEREAPWDLLKTFNLMKDDNSHLLLVGDGPIRSDLEEYVNNNIKNKVTFAGYIKYPELPKYYGISNVFVHTSMNEPWGVSVQEALAAGLPVITSMFVGASYDLIKEGENGFTYESNDVNDLKSKIEKSIQLEHVEVEKINKVITEQWSYKSTLDTIKQIVN
jgi:glycosyltransferase involved in cell wall biosynthesis